MSDNFYSELQAHLWKCEIEFTADRYPHGHKIEWLSEFCTSTESIAQFLRSIGFKIKEILDEEPWPGEVHQWVVTTSGIVVYVNTLPFRSISPTASVQYFPRSELGNRAYWCAGRYCFSMP